MEKLFLLDAYALIYRAYYAFIKNPRMNSKGVNTSAIFGFVNTLEDLIKRENPTHIGIAFDPSGPTFRHELYEAYKAQREETPEVIRLSIPIIKEIIKGYHIPIIEVAGFEADDVIGTLATQAHQQGIKTYMMTPDKDYAQLVTDNILIYRPKFGDKEFEVLGVEEIQKKYEIENTSQIIDFLGLMGDTSDNIPGCPGVGPKTAVKLIQQFGSIENMLSRTDELKGTLKQKIENNREQIKLSKFLATIKTDVPIELNMDNLIRRKKDEEKLRNMFLELEFRNLGDRVFKVDRIKEENDQLQPNLFEEFRSNGKDNFKNQNLTTLNDTEHSYHLIDNEDDMRELVELFLTSENISIDTETDSIDPIKANLVGLSFSRKENEAYYIPIPEKFEEAERIVNIFKSIYEDERITKIGQNLKFDMLVLANYGVKVKGELFDTMIAHYIIAPELRHNMDYMAETLLNYSTIKIEELIGSYGKGQKNMKDLSPTRVYEYACEDADVTLKLKNVLEKNIKELGLEKIFYQLEMPLLPVLVEMEHTGAKIDTIALQETSNEFSERLRQIEHTIYELAGESFNISSTRQVGDILFTKLNIAENAKKTKGGQYMTSEEVLEKLRHTHPIVEQILTHRKLKKLLSTYIDTLPKLVNERTKNIHSSFNQTVTTTGRLSSSNPNLQNIPIRSEDGREIRKAFIPDENCSFFSADYSQIELRIMAHLSGDKNMIEAFTNNQDIHTATAAKIYKKNIDEVTKEERSKAKTANFGIIYGITAFGLAERMNVSRTEAKDLIENYFATYPRIKEYMDESIRKAREIGYTETIFKRRCNLPDINSNNSIVRGYAERNAINAPIQGSAADIIKLAMINIHNRFAAENIHSKMILQVHDELNFSVLENEREIVKKIVIEEMESAYKMQVPLVADCGWGKNWFEAH